ncbi:MAG: hypothetical protein PHX78_02865 [bacterium]|nr:hypothetical protein [bacterium]
MIINETILTKYPRLKNLPEAIINSLERDEISLKTVLVLAELPIEESEYLLAAIIKYYFGVNKQQELIKLAVDIKERDNISLNEFLPGIEKEIIGKNLKEADRGTFLISRLREKRYPQVSAFKKELEEKKNILKREGFDLILPSNIEEEGYKIEISFRDDKDLLGKVKKLETIIHNLALKKFGQLRESVSPFAEKQGLLTDDDILKTLQKRK